MRRGDHAVQSALPCDNCHLPHLRIHRMMEPDLVHVDIREARQHRYRQEPRGACVRALCGSSAHHRPPAACVDCYQLRAQCSSFGNSIANSVWNVMQLQIEKDSGAARGKLLHKGRAVRDERLHSHFEKPDCAGKSVRKRQNLVPAGPVKCDDEWVMRLHGSNDKTRSWKQKGTFVNWRG